MGSLSCAVLNILEYEKGQVGENEGNQIVNLTVVSHGAKTFFHQ